MASASVAAASPQPLRIVSRRARLLLEKHRAAKSGQPTGGGAASRAAPKQDETPWPPSLRYTFYAACVASVPFSIGQGIALSPRLREWMLGDDVEECTESSGGGLSAGEIISTVRQYWGYEDYVPPLDRPFVKDVVPGYRNAWEEDNSSSLLHLFGLYTPPKGDASSSAAEENVVPMSLDNEPPFNIRHDQRILSQYLSTKSNPTGVKTKLSLIPCKPDFMNEGSVDTDRAGYETECTLPANTSLETLRALCQGSDAQSLKRDLAEADPAFHSKSTNERIRTQSWNEDCRWVVSFADADDEASNAGGSAQFKEERALLSNLFGEIKPTPTPDASSELRHKTSGHSSWSYFADNAPATSGLGASLGSTSGTSAADSSSASESTSTSTKSLEVLRLEYQIETLEKELKDPSSMRDRDGMYEELRTAKRELRSLKPWWRRYWG